MESNKSRSGYIYSTPPPSSNSSEGAQDLPYHEILPMLPSLEDYIHIALSYKLLSSSIDHRSATKINVHTHCLWNTVLNNLDGR